jgi:major vault protein
VVVGPQTILLEFDQQLTSMAFSTGKPKNCDKLYNTAFLRVLNNQVSDIIDAMTSDDIPVKIKTSYRVNFLPESKEKWFEAENYVKLLCDHVRSKIRNVVKNIGIQDFNKKYIDLVRDTVLGVGTGEGEHRKPRPGMTFKENGAHIYDVEVLGLEIGDREIANQLQVAQRQTIQDALRLVTSRRNLALAEEQEQMNQKLEAIHAATSIQKAQLQKQVLEETNLLTTLELQKEIGNYQTKQTLETEKQKVVNIAAQSELDRNRLIVEQTLNKLKEELDLRLKENAEESKQLAERTKAVTPDLVAALQRFGDESLVEKMADSMAPLAILGGKSVAEVLGNLLRGTGLENLTSSFGLGKPSGKVETVFTNR